VKGPSRHPHAAPLLVLALVLGLVYVPYVLAERHEHGGGSYLKGDCVYYRTAIVSLLEDGDLSLGDDVPEEKRRIGQLALGRGDRLVPKHPILMPLVALPFHAAFGDPGLLLFNLLQLVALLAVVYGINARFLEREVALASALLFGTATLFLNYSYNFSPDVFSSLLLLTGVLCALGRSPLASAVFLGLSVFAKVSNLPLVAVVGLFVAHDLLRGGVDRRALGRLAAFGVVLALSMVPLLVSQEVLYGSPFASGYRRAVTEAGFDDHVAKFNQPLLAGLWRLVLHDEHGLVTTNPVLILSGVGALLVPRNEQRRELLFLGALCLVQLLFFALYDEWHTSHWSNRFLMTTVALGSVFAGLAMARAWERGIRTGSATSQPRKTPD